VVDLSAKSAGQDEDLSIGDATHLGFDLGYGASGQPPTEHAATSRKLVLSDIRGGPQTAYLRTDCVANFHAPVSELDGTRYQQQKCSDIGASFYSSTFPLTFLSRTAQNGVSEVAPR
jgi:hypothetical protein